MLPGCTICHAISRSSGFNVTRLSDRSSSSHRDSLPMRRFPDAITPRRYPPGVITGRSCSALARSLASVGTGLRRVAVDVLGCACRAGRLETLLEVSPLPGNRSSSASTHSRLGTGTTLLASSLIAAPNLGSASMPGHRQRSRCARFELRRGLGHRGGCCCASAMWLRISAATRHSARLLRARPAAAAAGAGGDRRAQPMVMKEEPRTRYRCST